MATRFCVLGSGAWGAAMAMALAQRKDHQVRLWCARPEKAQALRETRENAPLLPGVKIPETIEICHCAREAAIGADLLIVAIPTAFLRATLGPIAAELPLGCPALSLVKGLENGTFLRPTEIIRQLTGPRSLAVLSGPSHAEEVCRGMPTSVVIASGDLGLARWAQQHFSTDRFRVYTNLDVLGVELAGALKNVVGIAAGACDGLGLGDNAKAALLTRGLAEIARFGIAFGAEAQTFSGLAGMGDLITTCFSRHGRNRMVGERLARGEKAADVLSGMKMVAEGVNTTRSAHEKARQMGLPMPVTEAVHQVLFEGLAPIDAVSALMLREPTSEG